MIGRLIVALLVILSAAAVMFQRQQAEVADVNAQLSEDKVSESSKKLEELEGALRLANEELARAQARGRWLEGEMRALAEDCTPTEEDELRVRIAAFKWRGVGADMVGSTDAARNGRRDAHFSLVLDGDAAGVERVHVFSSTIGGVPHLGQHWDTREPSAQFLGVVNGFGLLASKYEERLPLETEQGMYTVELVADDSGLFSPGRSFTVEVSLHDGTVLQKTLTVK